MSVCRWLRVTAFFFAVAGCSRPLPELKGFDRSAWADDRNGCFGKRAQLADAITKDKDKLLTLDQLQVVEVLGKPDHNELYKRNQKFFYYYVDAGPACPTRSDTVARRLVVRFNAMGLAKEILIEKEGDN